MSKAKTLIPFVSVVLPVYNAGRFLAASIDSILAQTYQNFELILIDDASSDNSLQIIKKYQKKFPRKVRVISLKNNLNRGGDACANIGIAEAKGKLIARMDADDIATPDRLEKQVAFLQQNPEIFLVGSNAFVINQDGELIGEKKEPQKNEQIYRSYFTFNPLIHPTAMFRAKFSNGKPFKYAIKYSANNDLYTFFKLQCQGARFENMPENLLCHRIHGGNDTFHNIKQKFFNTLKIRFEMIKNYGYEPSFKQIMTTLFQLGIILVLPNSVLKNLYLFSKGIKSVPSLQLFIAIPQMLSFRAKTRNLYK